MIITANNSGFNSDIFFFLIAVTKLFKLIAVKNMKAGKLSIAVPKESKAYDAQNDRLSNANATMKDLVVICLTSEITFVLNSVCKHSGVTSSKIHIFD